MLYRTLLQGLLCFLFCVYTKSGYTRDKSGTILIYGLIRSEKRIDSVNIRFSGKMLHPFVKFPTTFEKKFPLEPAGFEAYGEQYFRCEIPAGNTLGYLSISVGFNDYMNQYLAEPGDSIKIRIDCLNNCILFAGPASTKFRCQYDMQVASDTKMLDSDTYMETFDKLAEFNNDTSSMIAFEKRNCQFGKNLKFIETSPRKNFERFKKSLATNTFYDSPGWKVLLAYRRRLSTSFFEILRADLLGKHKTGIMQNAQGIVSFAKGDEVFMAEWRKFFTSKLKAWPLSMDSVSEDIAVQSVYYLEYLSEWTSLEAKIFERPLFDIINSISAIKVRDYLLGSLFVYRYQNLPEGQGLIEYALRQVKDSSIHAILSLLYERKKNGAEIPSFIFWNAKNEPVGLRDFKGKVVFIDSWFTGCNACIYFFDKTLKKVEDHFRGNKNFVLLSLSIDKDKNVWEQSVKQEQYTSAHAVNVYTGIESSNHPFIRYFNIIGYPHQLLIGADNKVYRSGNLRLPAEELIMIIEAALQNKQALTKQY